MDALLSELRSLDVRLWVEGELLRYSAPKGALSPALLSEVRARKEEILAFLRQAAMATRSGPPPIQPAPRTGESLPLSFAQQRLWFLTQLQSDASANASYNMPGALRLEGPLDVAALERSLSEILRRHETLRTTFPVVSGTAVQAIAPAQPIRVPLVDLTAHPEAERETEVRRLAAEEALRPFELTVDALLRCTLLRLAPQSHVLLITLHHITADAWSIAILFKELVTLYEAFSAGRPSPLPELPIQYADFAWWQRRHLEGEALARHVEYWKQQLAGAPPLLELPSDHPRPPAQTFRGGSVPFQLDAGLSRKLKQLGEQAGATPFMTLLAAWSVLLSRYSGQEDIVVGSPIANRTRKELEPLIGFFVNTLVLRTRLDGAPSFLELLGRVKQVALDAYAHQDAPFEHLVEALQPERNLSHPPLFQVMFMLQNAPVERLELAGLRVSLAETESATAKFDLTLSLEETAAGFKGGLEYSADLFERPTIVRMVEHLRVLLEGIVAAPHQPVSALPLLGPAETSRLLREWNDTGKDFLRERCIHELFEAQAARTPEAVAVVFEDEQLTYRELNARANQLARHLRAQGVGPETLVGICVERSLEMVVGLLGILKAGGAYLPLDPATPRERLAFMLEDARAPVLLLQRRLAGELPAHEARAVYVDDDWGTISTHAREDLGPTASPNNRAYVIYTSGSTGRPKGVMIEHRQVMNFFTAMDERIGGGEPGTWLAVTTISFDISVLELLWTLARGFRVVVQGEQGGFISSKSATTRVADKELDFSLFYFASATGGAPAADKYRLLLEGARFADEHGFSAVWTPERHFHVFGGLYPNPSVTSAALATMTRRVQLRAGSVVLPLHHPLRVAEEWSVVDNLSNGRVGLSFASGWQANDFVLAPGNYASRKELLRQGIETVRRLWRGESLRLPDGAGKEIDVQVLPRPIQRELPVWVTAAGTPETFRQAGELGARVLTHLLGQSVEQLAEKIALYREAWRQHGHGPGPGHVTLMLHTFVGTDEAAVRETVRGPFTEYLRSSFDLLKNLAQSLGQDIRDLSEADMEALLAHAFERFYDTAGLFGTPESCQRMIERLKAIGVDEVACLIDFGVDTDAVLASLHHLNTLKERCRPERRESRPDYSLPAQVMRHRATHLQCTPSLARMLLGTTEGREALGVLRKLMVGGEELPVPLARQLVEVMSGELHNMYGPTETTVWSLTHRVEASCQSMPIGRPIANTRLYILDGHRQLVPVGVPGELYIGGEGVVRGYLNRPELTAERFIQSPFGEGERLYRTGDLARYRRDGNVEFLGRADNQVKIRGFRIELGEIDAVLGRHAKVRQAVVAAREDTPGDKRLVAYVVAAPGESPSVAELRHFLGEKLPEYMLPAAFVMLEKLPQTPNGKVDRKALPAPDLSGQHKGAGFVAPRDSMELQLAAIWESVLKVQPVGVRDSFFQLGGHSLLAVQLMARIERQFGKRLPLATLFRAPTIEQLAILLTRSSSDPLQRSSLVEIQQGDASSPPLFCVPGAGGNLIYFYDLVRHMGGNRTVYGLQPVYSEDSRGEGTLVEEMAAHYLEALRSVQPHGPYLLVGHSFGGHVALEMSRRLRQQGEEVALLAVLDSLAPLPRSRPLGADWDDAEWVRVLASTLDRLYQKNLAVTREELVNLPAEQQVELLMERMKARNLLPPEADATQFRGFVRTYKADQQSAYTPASPYPGRITFLRASVLHPDNVPIEELRWTVEDPAMGWGRFSTQAVEVHQVPGDHLSMMTEPHVRSVAGCLKECIDKALAGLERTETLASGMGRR
ncbi:LLM class flavin-dependent oxidoreductase [Archangium violaceum]|nr:LLM class flavin-dependent oxidoreductase [Archangium violaceum]